MPNYRATHREVAVAASYYQYQPSLGSDIDGTGGTVALTFEYAVAVADTGEYSVDYDCTFPAHWLVAADY